MDPSFIAGSESIRRCGSSILYSPCLHWSLFLGESYSSSNQF